MIVEVVDITRITVLIQHVLTCFNDLNWFARVLSCFLSVFEGVLSEVSGLFSCGGRCAGIMAPTKALWCGCWCSISSLPSGGKV